MNRDFVILPVTLIEHSEPAFWPEVAAGRHAPAVCDFCHASLGEIEAAGHREGCDSRGWHMHPVGRPVESCLEWRIHAERHIRLNGLGAPSTMHLLYRIFGDGGALLYIGITDDLAARWNTHRRTKEWWHELRTVTIATYPTRKALEAAEVAAIKAEKPRYNVVHNRPAVVESPSGKVAMFVGGPLDGEQVAGSSGKWATYRDDHGKPIPPTAGDRQFGTFAGRPLRRHYVYRPSLAGPLYVHATIYDKWREASKAAV